MTARATSASRRGTTVVGEVIAPVAAVAPSFGRLNLDDVVPPRQGDRDPDVARTGISVTETDAASALDTRCFRVRS